MTMIYHTVCQKHLNSMKTWLKILHLHWTYVTPPARVHIGRECCCSFNNNIMCNQFFIHSLLTFQWLPRLTIPGTYLLCNIYKTFISFWVSAINSDPDYSIWDVLMNQCTNQTTELVPLRNWHTFGIHIYYKYALIIVCIQTLLLQWIIQCFVDSNRNGGGGLHHHKYNTRFVSNQEICIM